MQALREDIQHKTSAIVDVLSILEAFDSHLEDRSGIPRALVVQCRALGKEELHGPNNDASSRLHKQLRPNADGDTADQ